MNAAKVRELAREMAAKFRESNVPRPWRFRFPPQYAHLERIANEAVALRRKRMRVV